jgi:hypothetical protein
LADSQNYRSSLNLPTSTAAAETTTATAAADKQIVDNWQAPRTKTIKVINPQHQASFPALVV